MAVVILVLLRDCGGFSGVLVLWLVLLFALVYVDWFVIGGYGDFVGYDARIVVWADGGFWLCV